MPLRLIFMGTPDFSVPTLRELAERGHDIAAVYTRAPKPAGRRGAAPINRAVMAGDKETGVMVMRMEEGLDTGPVAMTERVPIAPDATAGDLHDRLAPLGAKLMGRALAALERNELILTPQPE